MQALAQMPGESAAAVRDILIDIDDTQTADGRLPADACVALERLEQAGISVMPITGRPAGWYGHIAHMWPARAVMRENGAVGDFVEMADRPLAARRHGQLGI